MEKISILYLIDQMRDMGGAERNLLNIMTNIDRERFNFSLYIFQSGAQMRSLLYEKNINYFQIPYPTTMNGLKEYLSLTKKIRDKKINILHSYFEGSDIWGTLLAKLSGIPVIISSKRDMGFSKNKKILAAYRIINPFVTKIIAVSDAVKRQTSLQEKINLKKIITIYNGVDLTEFNTSNHKDNIKTRLKLKKASAIVGVLANIRPIKGIEFFIHAAFKVLKQFPRTQFIVIGSFLPIQQNFAYYEMLKSLIVELKIEKSFFFLGERSDIPDMLSVMDISVLPSLSEGFSNTVIESMAAGKPLVVTDVGGNSEAVIHGDTGFVVPPKNIDRLAEAISFLLANKKLVKKMGETGRMRAKQLFSMEQMITKIEDLYITTVNSY